MLHINDLAFRRQVSRLHALGPRAVAEFLLESTPTAEARAALRDRLERYSGASPEVVVGLGGDAFSPVYAYFFDADGNPRPARRVAL
jgi:hypothetical protein